VAGFVQQQQQHKQQQQQQTQQQHTLNCGQTKKKISHTKNREKPKRKQQQ